MCTQNAKEQIKTLIRQWASNRTPPEKTTYAGPVLDGDEYCAIIDALMDEWWSGGKYTLNAERSLAQMCGRERALLCNSGSSANLLLISALKELYLADGDKVATLSCGFTTTVSPLIQNHLVPLFIDIDLEILSLSPTSLEYSLHKFPDIKMVFVGHTLGFKHDIAKLAVVCAEKRVRLCFDACDAYGTNHLGRPIQEYGTAATLSFYPAHHLTMGEGGAVVTDDMKLIKILRSLRSWGRRAPNDEINSLTIRHPFDKLPDDYPNDKKFDRLGYNLKPLELQAAMLIEQIKKLPEFNIARRKNYNLLHKYMQTCRFDIKTWAIDDEMSPFAFPFLSGHNCPFSRADLVRYLDANEIDSRMILCGNLMRHPAYGKNSGLWQSYGKHPNADRLCYNGLMIGVGHHLPLKRYHRVIEVLDKFFAKY